DVPPLVARRNIQKHQLVRPLRLIPGRHLYRIARIPQVQKIRSLDDPPPIDIEARYYAVGEHLTGRLEQRTWPSQEAKFHCKSRQRKGQRGGCAWQACLESW